MNFRGDDGKRGRVETTLELTPLIDVIFLLLIFFVMTTTPAMNAVQRLDVDLPEAASGQEAEQGEELQVVARVQPDGEIYLREGDDADERHVDDVHAEFATLYDRDPGARIWIQGDVKASHGAVVELLDITRTVGFDRVHMAVSPDR